MRSCAHLLSGTRDYNGRSKQKLWTLKTKNHIYWISWYSAQWIKICTVLKTNLFTSNTNFSAQCAAPLRLLAGAVVPLAPPPPLAPRGHHLRPCGDRVDVWMVCVCVCVCVRSLVRACLCVGLCVCVMFYWQLLESGEFSQCLQEYHWFVAHCEVSMSVFCPHSARNCALERLQSALNSARQLPKRRTESNHYVCSCLQISSSITQDEGQPSKAQTKK